MTAGARAGAEAAARAEAAESEANTDEPDDGGSPCRGIGDRPDDFGDTVITDENGRDLSICRTCAQWVPLHNGAFLPHPASEN